MFQIAAHGSEVVDDVHQQKRQERRDATVKARSTYFTADL